MKFTKFILVDFEMINKNILVISITFISKITITNKTSSKFIDKQSHHFTTWSDVRSMTMVSYWIGFVLCCSPFTTFGNRDLAGHSKFLYRTNVEFQIVSALCSIFPIVYHRTYGIGMILGFGICAFVFMFSSLWCVPSFIAVPCSVVSSVWMPFPLLCVGAVLVCCFIHNAV